MNKNTNLFERLMQIAAKNGYNTVPELSEALGYKSPEKLYRLKRDPKNKPSYDIIEGITNLFDFIDFKYLITGETSKNYNEIEHIPSQVNEEIVQYNEKLKIFKTLFDTDNKAVESKIDDLSAVMAKFYFELKDIKQLIKDIKINDH